MNRIFFAMVCIAFVVAAWHQLHWVPPDPAAAAVAAEEVVRMPIERLTDGMMKGAKASVDLALSLVGVMALFLGLMKVAESGGLLTVIAKLVRPLMVRLFPEVPPDHPAMGAMILNMSANALGLGNAATPFGIRAMQELDKLNPHKGTASNSMVLFLAINTSSVTILPTGVIGIRDTLGSQDAAGIMSTTLFATASSTAVAILVAKLLQPLFPLPDAPAPAETPEGVAPGDAAEALPDAAHEAYPLWVSLLALGGLIGLIPLSLVYGTVVTPWVIPVIVLGLLGYGYANGVAVYEVFVVGAREGFDVAVRIIPYLVAILVAVAMLRESGALGAFVGLVGPVTSLVGLPAEALPMALLRPLSGSGAMGVMMDAMKTYGPDSYVGYLVSTIQGSSETTFYVLAVYFGAVQVKRMRHAMVAALTADVFAVGASVAAVSLYFAFNGLS